MPLPRRRLFALTAAAALAATSVTPPAEAAAGSAAGAVHRPVVFVHGSAGSALQFRIQAKRLAANGYPSELIGAHEYDSPSIATILPEVHAGLDARITRLLATSGADRVDLVAHSLGTYVVQAYLNSSPTRAARVAHYVNLDGRTATAVPGGVPTLAIWGEGDPAREVTGAINVRFPDQSHTQTVSSAESFREVFRFLRDREPHTTRVVPQPAGAVRVSGRAVIFPSNAGVTGATLEVHAVSPLTGHRMSARPAHVTALAADGSFGPLPVRPHSRYEFVLLRPGQAAHHFYFEPFRRTDTLVRLLTSRPGEGLGALVDTSDRHTALTIQRQKEWWGDQGDAGDRLWINGRDILNPATAPRAKRAIGIFAFDDGSDGVTDLTAPLPEFFAQTFITGMDVFIPASAGRPGSVSIVTRQRGGGLTAIPVPNWSSSAHRVSVEVD
ncbi:alpha/beta hydrolase [Actinoplanes auranticolor]|uniref:Lipase n=1 Tax=Actinoplanes auranticolor TaxID=47988 RepID=A0A919SWQ5_9ACTN|nr:alpha/beta hydrolase [Actinoplanes auranticolor]GIM79379.1 lipase [Actinoplanes auranticolor]